MTGAVQAASPAAPAAGNATLLSAQPDPAPDTTPTPPEPPAEPPAPPAEGDTPPAEEPKEGEGAPEDYGTFALPEGVTVNQAALDVALPEFKQAGLTQEQAQVAVGLYAKIQTQQAEAHAAQVAEWAKAVVADKEIGGAKWDANRALVAQARNQFATPELLALMDSTGLGSHPEVIKLFVKVGKAIADDGHVTGGGSPTQPTDYAAEFFARMPKRERVS